jgi:hypothetical protein
MIIKVFVSEQPTVSNIILDLKQFDRNLDHFGQAISLMPDLKKESSTILNRLFLYSDLLVMFDRSRTY